MTEHESLLEAILDDPDDKARRLVYADWLEEHGSFADGIRAKVIRLHVQEDRDRWGDPDQVQLRDQIEALWKRYGWMMLPSLPPGFSRPLLHGPFIYLRVTSTAPRFVDWGEDYRGGLPPYCRLQLDVNKPPARGKLCALLEGAAWPMVSGVSVIKYTWTSAEVGRFAADERIRGLEELGLYRSHGVGDAELEVLANSPHLSRLHGLTLYGDAIGAQGLTALARAKGMPKLRSLAICPQSQDRSWEKALQKARPNLTVFCST